MTNPNWAAYLALLIWPLISLGLYSTLPISKATLWTILGAYLLLPVGAEVKFSGIPAFDKSTIPNLSALLFCSLLAGRSSKLFHGIGLTEALVAIFLVSPFITSMLNSDPIDIGITHLPGVGPYDAVSAAVSQFIFMIPFFLGRRLLRRPENNAELLHAMTIAGLAYSLPMLFEIRMSPQIHAWLFGYYPTDFIQEIRDGGFRPMVLMGHGLLVAFFAMTVTVASAALWRTKARAIMHLSPGAITCYLSVVLILCKTGSALLYAGVLVPLVRWARPRLQFRVACGLVLITLTYPLLRATGLVPTTEILRVTNDISHQRAGSLETRFQNEDHLLDRAWQRPWFGWGRFGRSRVYSGWDGGDSSVTDGEWIITMGSFGIVGFVAQFGLLSLTVFRGATVRRFTSKREAEYLAALGLIVAINIFDLLPNSSIRPWTWLLAGALLGRAEDLHAVSRQRNVRPNVSVPLASVQETQTSAV